MQNWKSEETYKIMIVVLFPSVKHGSVGEWLSLNVLALEKVKGEAEVLWDERVSVVAVVVT